MGQPSTITEQNGTLLVSGDLTFVTVMQLWNASLSLLAQQSKLELDLSQVATSDSAGVALMIEWVKYAKQAKKLIRFQHIPAQLASIIAISGIKKLLT
jgi:phospholipid transport system transporter-binding protein